MSRIHETELPGIGKKFLIHTRLGDRLVVIIHNDGRREMYHFADDDLDEAISQITLEDDEARQIAAILGGMTYKPKALETIEVTLEDLIIEWLRVEPHFKSVEKSLAELKVRERTGATVLAIVKRNEQNINPGPTDVITAGSTLVLAGERKQIKQFKDLIVNGGKGNEP
ncbi:cation:proton antiporter regulatory subunit [Paenibacillus sp. JCM 10914]|uniref:cation:proton antiporter regulatory subunit n=1 Tax=Paenibacillus sp. JCM 10914 TaxID=1236974 RepID=UPI0003CC7116|nr:cation:proton antiporter regulatory subunit [Paenibacillus sp. JCM 10914]GAE04335.1 potassium channel TrkA variant [Paenibacillus sp. JCM 10914]